MTYTKAISPVSNSYLTKGKEYEILEMSDVVYPTQGRAFKIKDDQNKKRWMYQHAFQYLNLISWQLK